MREATLTAAVALDAIEEGILVQDDGDNVVYANRAAGELLGIDRDALRGSSELPEPRKCLSDDGEALDKDGWPGPEARRTGRPQRPRVIRIRRPDGGVRWLRAAARPIGRSALTSLQDVTALRRAEEDAAALASRLSGNGSSTSVLSPRKHQVVELLAAGLTGGPCASASRPRPCACTSATRRASSARALVPRPWPLRSPGARSPRRRRGVGTGSNPTRAPPTTGWWPTAPSRLRCCPRAGAG